MHTDVKALDGPSHGSALRRLRGRAASRRLLAMPLVLALMAPAATALGAEPTTGYTQTPPPPKTQTTTTTTTTTPKQQVAPTTERESTTPPKTTATHEVAPTTSTTEPRARAAKLPFTGLDLRWVILGGVLLLGSGISILMTQRGRHGAGR